MNWSVKLESEYSKIMGSAATIEQKHLTCEKLIALVQSFLDEDELPKALTDPSIDDDESVDYGNDIPVLVSCFSVVSDGKHHPTVADKHCVNQELRKAFYHSLGLVYEVKVDDTIYCELCDLEDAVVSAFKTNKTPLLLDCSPDDKACTFYSYQPDTIILEAKTMIIESSKLNLEQSLEYCRKRLVNAMKFGKLLVIRMGTSAPDFKDTYNDKVLLQLSESSCILLRLTGLSQVLSRKGNDVTAPGQGYFPEEVFVSGGIQLFEEGWPERIFRDEDMKPHKNFAFCRSNFSFYKWFYSYFMSSLFLQRGIPSNGGKSNTAGSS